ncbi:MAG: hypothetical protein IH892_18370 [Planctomycetes bacterium]|nr:hypothetical protein [Planctomycetota bacterium]
MKKVHIPQAQSIRKIQGSFAWVDHRLFREGYLSIMTHEDQVFYLFLTLVADRNGVSFYRKEKICDTLSLDFQEFEIARDRLIDFNLIAYQPYSILSPNGYYQVLPIRTPAPNLSLKVMQRVAAQATQN